MKKTIVLIFFIFSILIYSQGLKITFPDYASSSIGISPIIRDTNKMFNYALEQASVYGARLENAFCIYESAILELYIDDIDMGNAASFMVNVVDSLDLLYYYYDNLVFVDGIEFLNYYIAFFNLYDTFPDIKYSNFETLFDIPENRLVLTDDKIYGIGIATHIYMEDALEKAFTLAMDELSRHQEVEVKRMNRNVDVFFEDAILISANNVISNVSIKDLEIFSTGEISKYFQVKLTLQKKS